ncbi:MAG: heavy metal translocating P-type ATPase [Pseudomonadota bacterium]
MVAACPGCVAAPAAVPVDDLLPADGTVTLSLPRIHCAACISGVERVLEADPVVTSARVNLTQKRVQVATDGAADTEALIRRLAGAGFEAHELDSAVLVSGASDPVGRDLLMRLAVAGFAMMNIMLLSVAVWSGAEDATRDLFHWISAAIALPTIAFSAQPFFRSAWSSLRLGRLNMDVPISLAILLAPALSLYETMQSGPHAYFDAAVSLTFFLLGGRYLDHRTRAAARSAAEELAALEVPRATKIVGGVETVVPVETLAKGDLVLLRPGARCPVDGVVASGASELDRSFLTGEALPLAVAAGQDISAGDINLTGPLTVEVSAAGANTTLRRMADLVAVAERARGRYTSLADRAAQAYAPGVHLLALFAFLGWLWVSDGDVRLALNIAVAVLIITCPCALGLAVPAVMTAATGRLFRRGFLVKDGTALERLALVDTVVFDKTGTLTRGVPEFGDLSAHDAETLSVAAGLSAISSHPAARTLSATLVDRGVAPAPLEGAREVPGYGVEAYWSGMVVRLGRAGWAGCEDATDTVGGAATWLSLGGRVVAFPFADALRDGAAESVAALTALRIDVRLLSGDRPAPVADVAGRLGIGAWEAGLLPQEKADRIAALRASGHAVAMVGDGLNDTVALASADVSLSPASALDAARVASDIIILGNDLGALGDVVRTARAARSRIRENFALATAYNVVAVPVALLGFATPLAAAIAMSTSSVTVSLNALRLR